MTNEELDDMEIMLPDKEEARDILESHLTEEDLERLHSIRHELSQHIRWGPLAKEALSILLLDMEDLIHKGIGHVSSKNSSPFKELFPLEQEFLQQKDLREQFVLLKLTKKLIGALKTRVNQALSDLPMLNIEDEEELRDLLADDEQYDAETTKKFFNFKEEDPDDFSEDEMDLVAEINNQEERSRKRFQKPMTFTEEDNFDEGRVTVYDKVSFADTRMNSDPSQPDSDTNCHHTRTTITFVTGSDGLQYKRIYCKSCRRVVKRTNVSKPKKTLTEKEREEEYEKLKETCEHKQVLWVQGKEGKEAYCTHCDFSPVPEPGKYNWSYVGLEPYGDEPTKDEVINLEEAMQCES